MPVPKQAHKPRPIQSRWLKGKTEAEQESIKHSLTSNIAFIDTLLEIIAELRVQEESIEESLKDYEDPSWPFKQANRNGAKRAYKQIEALFNSKETNIGK